MDRYEFARAIVERIDHERTQIKAAFDRPVATRTRHVAIDGLLEPQIAERAASAFACAQDDAYVVRNTFRERKRTSAKLDRFDPILTELSFAIQDPRVVAAVAAITGMPDIEPDPSLYAGGLSRMIRGDFLNPHIDNSHDGVRDRYRRLNLLYYVTPDWIKENGGNLELWDDNVKYPVTITSAFNRMVIMETNKLSWHSVSPVVVASARCCISSYYFSKTSPDASTYFHVTEFGARPEQPVRRVYAKIDARARGLAGRVLGLGRGKALTYKT